MSYMYACEKKQNNNEEQFLLVDEASELISTIAFSVIKCCKQNP